MASQLSALWKGHVRECRYPDGERIPQLLDNAGVPEMRITSYVTTMLRPLRKAYATMEAHVRGIERGMRGVEHLGIDLDHRVATTGFIFDSLELDVLARFCSERSDGCGGIEPSTAANYYEAFIQYVV